ncbi:cytochrome P450 [Brevundimonas nasdae]|uniref:Cytochrome P450 n=2 Tax=Pseudomonadota TaxID=1224 RepID=A0ABX8TIL9_9CAUL|nr:cytochrome P450 [Brevundimonas nasdae]QYC10509.1 cytochrome P450 [Brevundimonas nasdae]QYC13296.1 cytochrome P450 [Brevundimonas nasdae]
MTVVDTPFVPRTPARRTQPLSLLPFLWISWRDPIRMWSERHFNEPQLHGHSVLGEILVVSHPEGVRHVLTENASNYVKGDLQRRVLGPMLAEGLLLTEGDTWRRARRILAPLFTPAKMATLNARMAEVCHARVASWSLSAHGRVLDIDSEMSGLTFDILSATMFSDELGGEARGFERALNQFLANGARIDPLDVLGAPDWAPRLGRLASFRSARFFERRVTRLVEARRAHIEAGGEAHDDLLSALLLARDENGGPGLSDEEVAANILTFILAGHETTARALGWTLHLLSRQPEYLARLQAEADAFDVSQPRWADNLPWTRAVLEETMRLFPPAPTMARTALADDEVGGQKIKAGATVIISPWILQRHKLLWDQPDAFKPERFLPENRKAVDRYAYIPFSAGPRVCIGAAFAIQEAMIALAAILRVAEVEAVTAVEPRPVHQITLRSSQPMRLRLRARRKTV